MPNTRLYEHHGPYCPDDCHMKMDEEDLVEIFEDRVDLEKLRTLKKNQSIEGPSDSTIYYRGED